MFFIYAFIAGFIAWIWIDYFRLIDVYGKEDLGNIVIIFFLGVASTRLVTLLHQSHFLDLIPLELNGGMVNDFLYCVLKIGLVEEMVKMVPYIIMYLFFRSAFKEPIDYIAFAAISALGFAAAENTLYFDSLHGEVIGSRAILTSVSHMFFSSLIGYGIVLTKYRNLNSTYSWLIIPAFALLAILSHAFYDFWLINGKGTATALISILFFLVTLSWYSTILNNALNNDSTFSYKRTINADKVTSRIMIYYAIVFAIQFAINTNETGISNAVYSLVGSFRTFLYAVLIVSSRLSRFTLIQGRWQPIKLELPFSFSAGGSAGFNVAMRGNSMADNSLNQYYEEYFMMKPYSIKSQINEPKIGFIEKRLFLKDDETLHVVRIFKDETRQDYNLFLLKPKVKATVLVDDKYPIASLFKYKDLEGLDLSTLTVSDFGFIEWVYIKPIKAEMNK